MMEEGALLFFTGWLAGVATTGTLYYGSKYAARRARIKAFQGLTSIPDAPRVKRLKRFIYAMLALWVVTVAAMVQHG